MDRIPKLATDDRIVLARIELPLQDDSARVNRVAEEGFYSIIVEHLSLVEFARLGDPLLGSPSDFPETLRDINQRTNISIQLENATNLIGFRRIDYQPTAF